VVSEAEAVTDADRAAVRDLGGPAAPVLLAGLDGVVHTTVAAG
jgi:hypothetical protein